MVVLLESLDFMTCFLLVFLTVSILFDRRKSSAGVRIKSYLNLVSQQHQTDEIEESRSLSERLWLPLLANLGFLVQKFTPIGFEKRMEDELNRAGRPFGMSVKEYLGWCGLLIGLGFLAGTLLAVHIQNGKLAFLLEVAFVGVPLLLPRAILRSRIKERNLKIQRSLPDTLDLLTVSVEAGLGFDQALSKVVEKTNGPLAEEFRLTLQEIQMGKQRRDALKDLGERTGVEALIKFVNALIQADKLGVGIGKVLRIQAEDLRSQRRQIAEERAMKAPIKMLFPLIFFIFPALFVIILGPAVISLMKMFQSL